MSRFSRLSRACDVVMRFARTGLPGVGALPGLASPSAGAFSVCYPQFRLHVDADARDETAEAPGNLNAPTLANELAVSPDATARARASSPFRSLLTCCDSYFSLTQNSVATNTMPAVSCNRCCYCLCSTTTNGLMWHVKGACSACDGVRRAHCAVHTQAN